MKKRLTPEEFVKLAREIPLGPERRNEGNQGNDARVHEQLRRFGHPPDILDAVRIGEAEVLVQAVPHIVAIERVGVPPQRQQALLDAVGDRRLA